MAPLKTPFWRLIRLLFSRVGFTIGDFTNGNCCSACEQAQARRLSRGSDLAQALQFRPSKVMPVGFPDSFFSAASTIRDNSGHGTALGPRLAQAMRGFLARRQARSPQSNK